VLALLFSGRCAWAEDEGAAADEASPTGEGMTDDQKAAAYANSYGELQDKMQQLQSLLAAKGEGADPELKERLASLQQQLGALGMGDGAAPEAGSNPELTEFLTGCVIMSMRRIGIQRMSTIESLSKVVDGKMSPEQASKNDLWKMVAICVSEFTDKDLENFKAGKYDKLPSAYVAMSKEPKAEKAVMEIEDAIWAELKLVAATLVKQLGGQESSVEPAPIWIGMIGAVPFILAIGFLAKKFLEMQNREKQKDKKREGKNSGKKSK